MGKASASACNQLPESLPGNWELEFAYIDDILCLPEKNSGDTDNVSPKKEGSICHQGLLYQCEAACLVALIDYGFYPFTGLNWNPICLSQVELQVLFCN